MDKIKVLIADDSVVYRSQIKMALSNLAWVEVTGVAANGKLALDRMQQAPVDLLILDLEMPEMDGIQTLKELAARNMKCKVLVFSSSSKRGAEITFEALRLGASDFIAKPGAEDGSAHATDVAVLSSNPSLKIQSLLEPKMAALFPLVLKTTAAKPEAPKAGATGSKYPNIIWELFNPQVIVIGSSTGGPTVLETIFSKLQGPLKIPILITQHMPPVFTAALAERLQRTNGIPTVEATHGMPLEPNKIYIAPGNFHMKLMGSKDRTSIILNQEPLINSVRPAVDPLFEDAARIFKERCLAFVLTGMGADGKVGAEKVKENGGGVIIQNEASCVVFGMPGAVMASGAYDKVFTPAEITQILQEKAGSGINFTKKTMAGGV